MATRALLATATISGTDTATRITAGESSPTTRIPANAVCIQAHPDNTGDVYVGDSTVDSGDKKGIVLQARQSIQFDSGTAPNGLNLADYYFASDTASQKVNCFYVVI